jgi:hypothetical protein
MPEGIRPGRKGLLVLYKPFLPKGAYIFGLPDTLDFGAIDSAARVSAPHPCAQNLDLIPKEKYNKKSSLTFPN